jgi:hypothetical protein
MAQDLEQAYRAVKPLVGPQMEPMAVTERVQEHRAYWRPHRTRVVLLAESHVYTTTSELTAELRPATMLPSDLPRGFVRLVYCLGYGENAWLESPITSPRNNGKRQFWEIFYSCVHQVSTRTAFHPIHKSRTVSAIRMQNKIDLLHKLQDLGVWLVDASIAALDSPGQAKPSPSRMMAVLHASWDAYVERLVGDSGALAVLCVGCGVAGALKTRLSRLGVPWSAVPQPNARISTAEHLRAFAAYGAVCKDPNQIRSAPASECLSRQ